MKRLRLVLLVVFTVSFVACDQNKGDGLDGQDVTQEFLINYNGVFQETVSSGRNDSGERLTIDRDGEIEVLKIRQVGSNNDPTIPNPTNCSYILNGQIRYVTQLDESSRERVGEDGEIYLAPQTHNLAFSVQQITLSNELQSDTTSNPGCQNFLEKMNQALPTYVYGMELFVGGRTFRLHTNTSDDLQSSERSESTLDEVYVRQ